MMGLPIRFGFGVTAVGAVLCFICTAYPGLAQGGARVDPLSPSQVGRTEVVTALDHLAGHVLAKRREAIAAVRTPAEAKARQALVRARLLALIGNLPTRTPLHAQVLGTTQGDGFRIERVLFESQPGFRVTALLYLPDGTAAGAKRAAILMAPGHSPAGKAGDYFTAATFARNGFVVLSYDPIGQGERLQYPNPEKAGSSLAGAPTGEHGEASMQPMLIGDTVARYFLWDAMRAVDFLTERPEVDPRRIGAFGCSGGGAMTALVGALDPRIAAVGVACYNTSFDKLLSTIGPQDGEQSIPGFIAAGFDFPDWIELVAPRPYAAIATYSDMFPFSGALPTVAEARWFYAIFDPASAGTPVAGASVIEKPTGPALNVDTSNQVSPAAHLQFITGPGGHGALGPIMDRIVSFFLRNLQPAADADHPKMRPAPARGESNGLPKDALQVTATGQVSSSYPGSATVSTLNQARAEEALRGAPRGISGGRLEKEVRLTTGASAFPHVTFDEALLHAKSGPVMLPSADGVNLRGELAVPPGAGRHPAVLMLVPGPLDADSALARANQAEFERLAEAGNLVLALTPSPSPAGTDEMKSPLLGPFYLLSLRADLVGRTLIGLRTDDVSRAIDYLGARADVETKQITAVGSGHMGLVLMHAALLNPRLHHVTVDHVLSSYRSLIDASLPTGAPEDVVPGVLRHYDIPDLVKALGQRLSLSNPLSGADDLSQRSTPIETLRPH